MTHNKHTVCVGSRCFFNYCYISICVSTGLFLKGVDEKLLPYEDERLTPDIDEVMVISVHILKNVSKLPILCEFSKI